MNPSRYVAGAPSNVIFLRPSIGHGRAPSLPVPPSSRPNPGLLPVQRQVGVLTNVPSSREPTRGVGLSLHPSGWCQDPHSRFRAPVALPLVPRSLPRIRTAIPRCLPGAREWRRDRRHLTKRSHHYGPFGESDCMRSPLALAQRRRHPPRASSVSRHIL